MNVSPADLKALVERIFAAAGSDGHEAERIAHYLVESNLVGHDSHGVIRVKEYMAWLRSGKVLANQKPAVAFENDILAVVDGNFGFGQVMGEAAVRLGLAKGAGQGMSAVALRNSGHLGRIGDWAELAASHGKVSLHFVNTNGAGVLVAPVGGISRRLSANPIAAGVPVKGARPIVLDISTAAIAEGKIKVARNKGVQTPPGVIIDSRGQPTTDPLVFYGDPPGAILPLGGHKGYGLSVLVEVLAGALTGGHCSGPNPTRFGQGMLSVFFDPAVFVGAEPFAADIHAFIDYVKGAVLADPNGEILMPGEIEDRNREHRYKQGIELDETTWSQIVEAATSLRVSV